MILFIGSVTAQRAEYFHVEGKSSLASQKERKEAGWERGRRLFTQSLSLQMKRLTGVICVVSDFRVTQPPLLSCFLELSLTLGITAHPEETRTVISQEGRDTCLRTSAPSSAQRHPHSDTWEP